LKPSNNGGLPHKVNNLFPTLFSKTFVIVSAQLFITWLTTHFVFLFFKRIDPKLEKANPYTDKPDDENILTRVAEDTDPRYRWIFSSKFFYSILIFSAGLFLLLLFWGIDQPLGASFPLFSAWSFLTGIQLEYVLLNVEEGLGRKVLALTSLIVMATALIGIYSHVDFGFLQLPLFIALSIFLLFSLFNLFASMDGIKQRILSGFGVVIFTLYLIFDFSSLLKKENAGENTWPDAMHLAIKIYLDIINLILQLLRLLSKRHH
jgi:FtsH-binding integral membrane protein